MNVEQLTFFRSLSAELAAQASRVRQLIGDVHWYTDGALKEALLLDAIRRRIPFGTVARRGFVLSDDLTKCSTEQDCLIQDRALSSPVFEAVDFHMSPPGLLGTTSTRITGDQGTRGPGGEVARRVPRRDDLGAPKRVKARVTSSSLRS